MKMEHLCKVVEIAIPWLEKIEYFLHPRFTWLSRRLGHQFTGIICVVCAISVAMPFPFSNTVPSMGIVLMSLGLLERDGVVIVGGMGIGLAGVCLAIAVLYFGAEAVKMFFGL